ncbi:hypothetical protein NQZ68_033642 [Dissostichus eleginoides]|nr:hypothetical protein NQZ68_033642 [Dissostichus eleginoides]
MDEEEGSQREETSNAGAGPKGVGKEKEKEKPAGGKLEAGKKRPHEGESDRDGRPSGAGEDEEQLGEERKKVVVGGTDLGDPGASGGPGVAARGRPNRRSQSQGEERMTLRSREPEAVRKEGGGG